MMNNTNITLNSQQKDALDKILLFAENGNDERMCVLEGYAGTGKTTLMRVLKEKYQGDIHFTATTNKAARVLRNMLKDFEVTTIHSKLGLVVKERDGKTKLTKGSAMRAPLNGLVVIDEASMIGEELYSMIHSEVRLNEGTKILFVMDPAQLPPVGEDGKMAVKEQNLETSELTEVMRQRDDNPILGVCSDLRPRALGGSNPYMPFLMAKKGNSAGVFIKPESSFMDGMKKCFSAASFDADFDKYRIVCYTNAAVAFYNNMIHNHRYPAGRWVELGEPIVFWQTVLYSNLIDPIEGISGDDVFLNTETEGVVIGLIEERINIGASPVLMNLEKQVKGLAEVLTHSWAVTVETTEGTLAKVRALSPAGERLLADYLKKLAAAVLKGESSWGLFYKVKGLFAHLRQPYAITAHKAQGSTFENVWVDVLNVWSNRDKSEAARCLYVACSRPTTNLVINASGER
jgi:exodeoxyribonuclease-5